MTAAIVSTPQLGPPAAVPVPHLTAVPECEPPFDDESSGDESCGDESSGNESSGNESSGNESKPTAAIPAQPTAAAVHAPSNYVAISMRAHRAGSGTRAGSSGPATHPQRGATALLTALPTPAGKDRPTTIAAAGIPSWSSESDIGVRKTATQHLPPADRTASMLARALVEVISGRRPLAQLRVHCAPEIYAGLAARPSTGPLALPHLLTVHVCEPADSVAEVSAAFRRADRVRAVAFRLQGVDGRWRITALQLG